MTIYIIHHSHTDIGYTDLQEKVIYNHIDYIRSAIKIAKEGYAANSLAQHFRWNCETYFCVEQFFERASASERADFFDLVKKGNIGLSANYLNFTDLVDKAVLSKRIAEAVAIFKQEGIDFKVAMNADINGISLGSLDAYLDNGVEFLFTNVHCHHGMYPAYQNQKPYFWENKAGKKLLVFSGEHYNLGNALGLIPNTPVNFMTENYFGSDKQVTHIEALKKKVDDYLKQCRDSKYPYDFIPAAVSGVFSDNAPPNMAILNTIDAFNKQYGNEVRMQMVTLAEFYAQIKNKVADAPVFRGDCTDWWAHGVGSTPYLVKHYKEAQRLYHLCHKLDPAGKALDKKLARVAEDNLLLYAEHTWGHSATITNPYDTMVQNLDIRKNSYASKAHEASALNLCQIMHQRGDKLRYYDRAGQIKAININDHAGKFIVSFYLEVWGFGSVKVVNNKTQEEHVTQISSHPRGVLISFLDNFAAGEEKIYSFAEGPKINEVINTRVAYMGSERVRDIINDYDPITYTLPHKIENEFFRIEYKVGEGVTSFYNKLDKCEMLNKGDAQFFRPIYERTDIRTDVYEERRLLGRNIRGPHAQKYFGQLTQVKLIDNGAIFRTIELVYELEGTFFSSVVIKMYNNLPQLEFKYKLAKNLATAIENIFLPLELNLANSTRYIDKSDVTFKPGVEQIPGTCMEYYLLDNGLIYVGAQNSILIRSFDVPLVYMGELSYHPIQLCNNKDENNARPIYSWLMNNIWETNFKMDLSGITEFCYSLALVKSDSPDKLHSLLKTESIVTFMCD